jgi:hypothetical protein
MYAPHPDFSCIEQGFDSSFYPPCCVEPAACRAAACVGNHRLSNGMRYSHGAVVQAGFYTAFLILFAVRL